MDKSLLFFELQEALGDGYSESEIAILVGHFSKAVNDNNADRARATPNYHSRPVDTAMGDGGWIILGMEHRAGNFANDNPVELISRDKIDRLLGGKL